MIRQSLMSGSLMLATVFIVGCGGSNEPVKVEKLPTIQARGFVKYKGSPLKDASVSFHSLDGKVSAQGKSDGVGSFTLSTYGAADGIPVGKYKVCVAISTVKEIEPGVLAPEPPEGFKSIIPTKYADPSKTDILVEVKAGDPNEFTIELK